VFIAAAARLLGFGFEYEGPFDNESFARFESTDDLDLVAEIAAATDNPYLEVTGVAWEKDHPVVAQSLQCCSGHSEDLRTRFSDRQARGGRHAEPQLAGFFKTMRIGMVRDSASTCRPTMSTAPGKVFPGNAGKMISARVPGEMRTASRSKACTVSQSVPRFAIVNNVSEPVMDWPSATDRVSTVPAVGAKHEVCGPTAVSDLIAWSQRLERRTYGPEFCFSRRDFRLGFLYFALRRDALGR